MNQHLIATALKYYGRMDMWPFPWCATFLNEIIRETGGTGTNSNLARSFLQIGKRADMPKMGDIVVLWRVDKNSNWGHCGLYIRETEDSIFLLGGNQDNSVKIKAYPKWQLLDIRTLHV